MYSIPFIYLLSLLNKLIAFPSLYGTRKRSKAWKKSLELFAMKREEEQPEKKKAIQSNQLRFIINKY